LDTPAAESSGGYHGKGLIGSLALVSYLSDPLRNFIDTLRLELSSGFPVKAHVTILPPRSMHCALDDARRELARALAAVHPIEVEFGSVEIFPSTQVVYLGLRRGFADLLNLHTALNVGGLAFRELFPYHPHVTLAQDLDPACVEATANLARHRWEVSGLGRTFSIRRVTLVQNVAENSWRDLDEWELG
jgi:2'-5' RNA ligase